MAADGQPKTVQGGRCIASLQAAPPIAMSVAARGIDARGIDARGGR